ncbi:MAG: redoxin domain-containing protein [Phycisphaerae bacterium]|nr:redoxin domain-containing protein [Phycisphaerae bacterium]
MDRRNTLLATVGLACALGAAALMGAATPPAGGTTKPKDKVSSKDSTKKDDARKDSDAPKAGNASKAKASVGQKAPDFQFTDLNGKGHSLAEFSGKTVVLQWMNPKCPICEGKMKSGEVAKMMTDAKAADPNVVWIFVNSTNPGMGGSVDASAAYLKDNKIEAIAFFEGEGTVGRMFGAETTPHTFVIDGKGVLAYSGAVDDAQSEKKGVNYTVEAVKAIKAGKTPSPATTKPYGCTVKYAKGDKAKSAS